MDSSVVLWRLATGFFLAMGIASAASSAGALTAGGAVVATMLGTLAVAAGWSWGALLIAYFVSSTLISRWHAERKDQRTGSVIQKGGARDGLQVLVNGGVFAIAALMALVAPAEHWTALGAGALAASASDTWATEIGTAVGGQPRSVAGWRAVPPGTSGAVSIPGTLAAVAGAAAVAGFVLLVRWPSWVALAAFIGGLAGSTLDTVLGALAQERRWCVRCDGPTERRVHSCGEITEQRGGLSWMRNDVVNLLSCLGGGLLAMAYAV